MKQHALILRLRRRLSASPRARNFDSWKGYRSTHSSSRQRRDDFWSPKVKVFTEGTQSYDTTTLLSGAGFIRQNYAGIYQFLPLGLRVLEKIERLIDKHMKSVGASKVSLSSISSQSLWARSGRLGHGEMFKFDDRADGKWLLAPTHEEEITMLLQDYVSSSNHLPVRLYQIGRKYRDEQRPRGGLLRGREFVMKDLYTFDKSIEEAETTYHQVRKAYRSFFNELGVPYVEVRADSGNMGGKLSHEFHFPNQAGEDTVIECNSCDFARNEEFVPEMTTSTRAMEPQKEDIGHDAGNQKTTAYSFISKDSTTLVKVLVRSTPDTNDSSRTRQDLINTHLLKAILAPKIEVDTGVESETAEDRFTNGLKQVTLIGEQRKICYVADTRVSMDEIQAAINQDPGTILGGASASSKLALSLITPQDYFADGLGFDLLRQQSGGPCPRCQTGKLKVQQAIEIGHTFHLGTRYTSEFGFRIPPEEARSKTSSRPFVEMGCHGIGVTRLLAASAACLSTPTQLRWPTAIAPYHVVICVDNQRPGGPETGQKLYDELVEQSHGQLDVLLDDREHAKVGYKMVDASQIGYPVVVVIGRALEKGMVEVKVSQDDYLNREDVKLEDAQEYIRTLLKQKVV